MKKILLFVLFFTGFSLLAQNDRSMGITVGVNEYYAQPTIAIARSGTGFSAGFLNGFRITGASEIVLEANFIRFNMEFYGQDIHQGDPEWIKFHSNRIGASAFYYYDVLYLMDNNLAIGLHGGPSVTYVNNFTSKGNDNARYQIAPYDIDGLDMKISKYFKGSPFNTFLAAGFNVHFKDVELNFRYYFALSSPYRNLNFNRLPVKIDGKDDYLSVSFNYYFEL